MWRVTADPDRFDEAVAFFESRFPVTEEVRDALDEYAGERAWTIAGVAQLEIVNDVHESLTRAIANGTPLDTWKKEVEASLTDAWGKSDSARIDTIFINATQQSYNAGRWRQMQDPEVKALRPYGFFDGVNDSRQSPICKKWDGTILPIDEFADRGACPQLHHRCRSQIRSIRESEARRRGITETPPDIEAAEGFGAAPTEAQWKPDPKKYPNVLWAEFQRKTKTQE